MINTYNESNLHNSLKNIFAQRTGGVTEYQSGSYICDIYSPEIIIEIQTANLSSLEKKTAFLIENHKIEIVFPVAEQTIIETWTEEGELVSTRKSPKKEDELSIFRQMTKLYKFVGNDNFSIRLVFVNQKQIRIKTEENIQLINKSRRFKKNWYKKNKKLLSINKEIILQSKSDFAKLIKDRISLQIFCKKDIEQFARKDAGIIIWVSKKMGIIEQAEIKGRKIYYVFVQAQKQCN